MGRRKRVKEDTKMKKNKNGNAKGETPISTSSTSTKRTRGQNKSTNSKIEGRENSSKKMKRDESLNSCEAGAGQSQESSVKEASINELPPENANGEPSTSSLYWTRSRKEAPHPEIKELELTSKRKKETNDSSNSPGQDEPADDGPINDLSPEMLTKILKYVDNSSLFDCRLISRQWCDISSEILTARNDIMLSFKDYYTKWVRVDSGSIKMEKYKSTRLQEFVNCIKGCENCPYASFFFHIDDPSFFDDKDWIGFLSVFAPSNPNQIQNQRTKIRRLHLRCDGIDNTEALLLFTEKLRDLLLYSIPRLEELGLDFGSPSEDYKNVKLFPKPPERESPTKTVVSSALVQLPYLKVLEIEASTFEDFPGIVEDLLTAAVNLTKIQMDPPWWFEGVFQRLYSLGKLHLLNKVEIEVRRDFLFPPEPSKNHFDFPLALKSSELELNLFASEIKPSSFADASNFISNLLKSSKDTLEKLEMPALGFLNELQFPKFTKLKTLDVWDAEQPLFPPGIRSSSREIFSTVANLNVRTKDWQRAFPQEDSIPIFSSVHTFCFSDEEWVKKNVVAKLALMCPNLKHCTIQTREGNPEQFNFPRLGRDIWTHLKQLESLEVDVDVNLKNHAFPAFDSCFTGISRDNCQRLSDLMKAEKAMKKSKSQVKLPESEALMTLTKRKHPSILDMKNLKKLTINPHSGERRHEGKNFFSTKITWISEEFAFKLMPHLEFNGRRPSTSS